LIAYVYRHQKIKILLFIVSQDQAYCGDYMFAIKKVVVVHK